LLPPILLFSFFKTNIQSEKDNIKKKLFRIDIIFFVFHFVIKKESLCSVEQLT